jgi:hypothetical protein
MASFFWSLFSSNFSLFLSFIALVSWFSLLSTLSLTPLLTFSYTYSILYSFSSLSCCLAIIFICFLWNPSSSLFHILSFYSYVIAIFFLSIYSTCFSLYLSNSLLNLYSSTCSFFNLFSSSSLALSIFFAYSSFLLFSAFSRSLASSLSRFHFSNYSFLAKASFSLLFTFSFKTRSRSEFRRSRSLFWVSTFATIAAYY